MRLAVLSDIHANLEAFKSVLEHISTQEIDGYLFTGDVVVYGPHPNECVELLFSLLHDHWQDCCIAGNNDKSIAFDDDLPSSSYTTDLARESFKRTQELITKENRHRLQNLPHREPVIVSDLITIVHATLADPVGEFTYMDFVESAKRESLRQLSTPIGVFGHTHKPAIYKALPKPGAHKFPVDSVNPIYIGTPNTVGVFEYEYGSDLREGSRVLVNAGSIGWPRDDDPRSAYMIIDQREQLFQFFRVPYNIKAVQAAMNDLGLPPEHVSRFEKGI